MAKQGDDNLYKEVLRKGEALTLINENMLVCIAERMTAEMFDFFVDTLGDELPISARVVEAAASTLEYGLLQGVIGKSSQGSSSFIRSRSRMRSLKQEQGTFQMIKRSFACSLPKVDLTLLRE